LAVAPEYKAYLEELFAPLGSVVFKRMFGGMGIFRHGVMFALIHSSEGLCFKADEFNIPDFEAEGSGPWEYERNGKIMNMGYWRVPERLLDEPDEFRVWAAKAYEAAVRFDQAKPPRQRKLQV